MTPDWASGGLARELFLQTADPVVLVAPDGRVVDANPAAGRVLGYTPAELRDTGLDRLHADRAELAAVWGRAAPLAAGDPPVHAEVVLLRKNGRRLPVELAISVVEDGRGALLGRLVVFRAVEAQGLREREHELVVRRLEAVRSIDEAILAAPSVREVALAALEHLQPIVRCARASVALLRPERGEGEVLAVARPSGATALPSGTIFAVPPADVDVLARGEPLTARDLDAVAELDAFDATLRAEGVRSYTMVPLLDAGELVASLNLSSAEPGGFGGEAVEIAREVGAHLAVALRRSMAHDAERAALERLAALQSLADVAITDLPLDELLGELLERIRSLLGTDTATVLLREGDELAVRASRGLEQEVRDRVRIRLGEGIAGRIALTGETVIESDVPGSDASAALAETVTSLLGVPLRAEGRVIGVVHVGSAAARAFGPEDVALLEVVADRAAQAVRRVQEAEASRRRAARLAVLHAIDMEILAEATPAQIALAVLPDVLDATGVDRASVSVVDPVAGTVDVLASIARGDASARALGTLPLPASADLDALAAGRTIELAELDAAGDGSDGMGVLRELGVRSMLIEPVTRTDGLLASLELMRGVPGPFGEDERQVAREVAAQLAIAEQQQAVLASLRESEERFRTLADAASVLIWTAAPDGSCTFVNRGWTELTGRSFEECLGRGRLADVHPDDAETVVARLETALDSREDYAVQYRLCAHDGTWRTVTEQGHPRHDPRGGYRGFVAACLDVTDLLAAEQARVEAQVQLELALQASPVGVGFVDRDLHYVRVNETFAEQHGRPVEEHIGRSIRDVLGPLAAELEPVYEAVLASRTAVVGREVVSRLTGEERRFLVSFHPVLQAGEAVGVGIVALEVTERHRLESRLQQSQKLEAIGRLAGGVAHDFNNLLTVIGGYVGMLAGELPADDPRRADLDEVRRAADRGTELTRQLLAIGRRTALTPAVVDVNRLVGGLAQMLRRVIGEDVRLDVRRLPGPASVLADAGQLELVLLNLAVNARDAMPEGGRLTIAVERDAGDVLVHVIDTGTGMTDETLEHVFEPFFTTKEPGKGTGLGLATALGIVEASGGRMDVRSALGSGTTFTIRMPEVQEAEQPQARARERAPGGDGGGTVLLVEDDDLVRELARTVLTGSGYRVVAAEDGERALEALETEGPIDVVVTDVVMPGISGIELAARIRELRAGTPVVLMSGYAEDALPAAGSQELAASILQKPFSPSALLARVRDELRG